MTVAYFTPRGGGRKTAGSNAPGAFLVIYFFGGHLPQTSGVRSAKQIHVVSFVTQARACILSDHNIFYIPRGWRTSAGLNVPVAFLVFVFFTPPSARGLVIPVFFFCRGQLPQTSARSKQYLPVNFVRLVFIRQNCHESWCRKLPTI